MADPRKPIHGDQHDAPDRGLALEEARPKVAKPPLFKVVLLNDDYTPMEFVVEVLAHSWPFRLDD